MAESEKKKVVVRRSRRATDSEKVTVKRRRSTTAASVVDLKRPVFEESMMRMNTPETVRPTVQENPSSWPFGAYKKLALTFIILAIGVLGAVAYFAGVSLDVSVVPKVKAVTGTTSFMVYDRPQDYTIPAGGILGMVREMDVEYSGNYPASGQEIIGAEVSGTVTVYNKYSKDQPLVSTTRLLTPDNQLLRIRNSVVVPAGGSVEAEVYGDSLDPSFTLADTKLTIPGLWAGLQDKIYAEAKAGAVSYKEQKKMTIQQSDLDAALDAAKLAIVEKAAKDIQSLYAAYDERLYNIDPQSLAFSFDAKAGDEEAEFAIDMKAKLVIVAFKKDVLAGLNETALQSVMEQGQALVDDKAESSVFKVLSADTEDNVAQVELKVDGTASPATDTSIVDRTKLAGLTRSQLESYLNSLETVESYELKFRPSFFEVAPQLADRINIIVK